MGSLYSGSDRFAPSVWPVVPRQIQTVGIPLTSLAVEYQGLGNGSEVFFQFLDYGSNAHIKESDDYLV